MAKKIKIDIGIAEPRGRVDAEIGFLIEKYFERHPDALDADGSLDEEAILEWAFNSGLYRPPTVDPKVQLRKRVRRHFGHRYRVTRSGRRVRALIAVPREHQADNNGQRRFGYYPLFETEPHIIADGLMLRHGWAGRRIKGIENDRLGYNEENIFGATIEPISYDFDAVLKRSEMPTEYPKSAPPNLDDEDDHLDD